ncbi:hypothetical protein [Streptomyces sp. NPDC048659]|uniref:hypothetical protein n=1 Tax=Streptomyces sp. NPDC048659 TaxID=3155489 RepID=UPI0034162988
MNRVGKRGLIAFIAVLATGFVLIHGHQVQVTVTPGTVTALGGVLSSAAVAMFGLRRHRR